MKRRNVLRSAVGTLLPSMVLLSGCPQECAPAPAPPAPFTAPAGTMFFEDFSTQAGFYDRFDMGLSGFHPTVDPNHITQWSGDHDGACNGPATSRTVHLGGNKDQAGELFWWCAPAGPDSGHVMTSMNTLGYNIVWFSPRQYFTNVSRVCWDQNLTYMGGRKWTQVSLAGRADVEREQAENGRLELGFAHPGFQLIGGPTTEVIPTDATVGFNVTIGTFTAFQGGRDLGGATDLFKTADKATRFRHCAVDNGNGTITLTQQRPDGQHTTQINGSFPDGEVRVAFEDANYDPPKDGDYDPNALTWHWDNIEIS